MSKENLKITPLFIKIRKTVLIFIIEFLIVFSLGFYFGYNLGLEKAASILIK